MHFSSTTSTVLACAPGCDEPVSAAVRRHDGRTVRGCARHCAEVLLADPGAVVLTLDDVSAATGADGALDPVLDTLPAVVEVGPLSAAAGQLAQRLVGDLGARRQLVRPR